MNYKKDIDKLQLDLNKTIKLLYSLDDMGTTRTYGTQARNLTKKMNLLINEFKNKTKNWDEEYKKTAKNLNNSDKNDKKLSKKISKKPSKKNVKQQGGYINNSQNEQNNKEIHNKNLIKNVKIIKTDFKSDVNNDKFDAIKNILDSFNDE